MTTETIDCPVCGCREFEPLFEKSGESFVQCRQCALVLINPRPVYEQILAGYDADYSRSYTDKADKKMHRARKRVARVISYAGITHGQWLDVGCSAGFVLAAARDAGFEVTGTDVEVAALAYARDTLDIDSVFCGPVEEQNLPAGAFDIVSLFDVIEHVRDLNALMSSLKSLLAPNGLIEIRTPDVGHWRVPRQLANWQEIKPSEHLYYFSKQTLARLCEAHGFVIEHARFGLKPALDVFLRHA